MRTSTVRVAATIALLTSIGCQAPAPTPSSEAAPMTLTIVNARVWTADPARPWAEALAIEGDTIRHVGTTAAIKAMPAARTIDARGRLVIPGFIESHIHFLEGGRRLASVQLRDAKTRDEFVERIRAFVATVPAGTWIQGGDWDHTTWGGELPARQWIDAVTPKHPVWVNRLDGHMALANSAALAAAGVTRATKDVAGGTIVRDQAGEPTGVLKDNAMALVDRHVPATPPEMEDRALQAAMTYVAERGVTSVHHMGTWRDLDVFRRADLAGRLTTRIYAAVPLATWERLRDTVAGKTQGGAEGRGGPWLKIGALKGFVDGSLGSHTAAFAQPFTDAPKDRGLFVNTLDDLARWISGADKVHLHVAVHAIGDRANHELLNIYERVARENGPRDRRFRIEHAQHLLPVDLPRFGALGVIASMQPYHAIDDGRWAERVIGPERAKTTYAFNALLSRKARLAFGSDWFVAPPTPLEGIYAAVTRQTLDGGHPGGWIPEERITVSDALRAYTTEAAYAEFAEAAKGRLAPGYLADVVMLDRDIFAIPQPEIRTTRVLLTIAGGKILVDRE